MCQLCHHDWHVLRIVCDVKYFWASIICSLAIVVHCRYLFFLCAFENGQNLRLKEMDYPRTDRNRKRKCFFCSDMRYDCVQLEHMAWTWNTWSSLHFFCCFRLGSSDRTKIFVNDMIEHKAHSREEHAFSMLCRLIVILPDIFHIIWSNSIDRMHFLLWYILEWQCNYIIRKD